MLIQLIILATLICLGIAVSLFFRRSTDAPSVPSYKAPAQLDPDDFGIGEPGHTLLVFTSPKCDSCGQVIKELSKVENQTPVINVVSEENKDLLKRYKIDGVPTTLLVDQDGVVKDAFFGPVLADEIEQAIRNS